MNHQPFETWMLEENNRTPEQEAELQAHLANCAECRQVRTGWQAARPSLNSARLAKPASGFTQRFSAFLVEKRAEQVHRRQIRNLIFGLSLGLIATAVLLAALIFTFTTPTEMLIYAVEVVTMGINRWNQVTNVLSAAILQPIFLVVWILATCGLSILVCGWLVTLWRISVQGAPQE